MGHGIVIHSFTFQLYKIVSWWPKQNSSWKICSSLDLLPLTSIRLTTNHTPGSDILAFCEWLNVYPVALKCICHLKLITNQKYKAMLVQINSSEKISRCTTNSSDWPGCGLHVQSKSITFLLQTFIGQKHIIEDLYTIFTPFKHLLTWKWPNDTLRKRAAKNIEERSEREYKITLSRTT